MQQAYGIGHRAHDRRAARALSSAIWEAPGNGQQGKLARGNGLAMARRAGNGQKKSPAQWRGMIGDRGAGPRSIRGQ